jgi:hypothetical protein
LLVIKNGILENASHVCWQLNLTLDIILFRNFYNFTFWNHCKLNYLHTTNTIIGGFNFKYCSLFQSLGGNAFIEIRKLVQNVFEVTSTFSFFFFD